MRNLLTAMAVAIPVLVGAQVDLSKAKLRNPASFTEKAPATYKAKFDTSKGAFVITVHRDWAPLGADRFYNLVNGGYYDECRFFRVLDDFMAQVGINGNPAVQSAWRDARIADDPVKGSNKRGMVSFATAGAGTRTTQFFINFKDNAMLDKSGFSPFGEVTTGMDVVEKLYNGYGEIYKRSDFELPRFMSEGNAYMAKQFPRMDYIKTATIAQ